MSESKEAKAKVHQIVADLTEQLGPHRMRVIENIGNAALDMYQRHGISIKPSPELMAEAAGHAMDLIDDAEGDARMMQIYRDIPEQEFAEDCVFHVMAAIVDDWVLRQQ